MMKKPSVYIVDDNPDNLQVLGNTLKNEDYHIEFATNGETALEWIKDQEFDLILLDVMMPEMDGFEVCKRIRSDSNFNDLPIIFLTAQTDKESILKGFECGAQDYVTKPFDTPELLARVKTHLELKNSRTQLEELNQQLEEKVKERTRQLHEANQELKQANIKLSELDHAKTEFLNLISHEIRTPLNGILGPAYLIKDRIGSGELDQLFEILDISVNKLEKFSLTALLITRLNTQRNKILKTNYTLKKIILDSMNELSEKISQKKIVTDLQENPVNMQVTGEYELLKTCLVNILDNAIRFSPQEGEIRINLLQKNKTIICEITDQGKGFAPEILENPFELFSSSEPNINGNIGVGLYLSKLIMEAHSGSIEVENPSSGGALIRLIFNK
jgi:two-component system sensor histidine kinase/response regulator